MPNWDDWFDSLYRENAPRMVKQAMYLIRNKQIAEEIVNEAFLILLYKKCDLVSHPNIQGWLSQTLKNLVSDELKSAKHQLELPLNSGMDIPVTHTYQQSLSEVFPQGLTAKDQEILILFYEKQLSYEQIADRLHILAMNCRTRMFRAKAHYKKLLEK